jgi:hypothetical protein
MGETLEGEQDYARAPDDALRRRGSAHQSFQACAYSFISTHRYLRVELEKLIAQLKQVTNISRQAEGLLPRRLLSAYS